MIMEKDSEKLCPLFISHYCENYRIRNIFYIKTGKHEKAAMGNHNVFLNLLFRRLRGTQIISYLIICRLSISCS